MHLFDNLDSGNGYKVRLLLAQLGLRYEWTDLDIDAGATRKPEFLKRNPNGRIPTLELDDGTNLAGVERDSLVPRRGFAVRARRSARPRADAAMDVLRAVQPRAVRRDAALHREAPARGPRAPRGVAATGSRRAAPRSRSWTGT